MPSVLVTGASGFIGSSLADEGLKRSYTVFAGIRKGSSRRWLSDPALNILEIDYSSQAGLTASLKSISEQGIHFDYVIHNAGVTKTRDPRDFYRINRDLTTWFVRALKECGLFPKRFVYLSSLAASTHPPAGHYGRSKRETEGFLCTLESDDVVIFRVTGVYGPRDHDYLSIIKAIDSGLEVYIGTDQQILSFIYIDDLVRLIFDSLEKKANQRIYAVSDGSSVTATEFSALLKSVLGRKNTVKIVFPLPVVRLAAWLNSAVSRMTGKAPVLNPDKVHILGVRDWSCSTAAIKDDFGFESSFRLEQGLQEAISWYKHNGWL